MARQNILIVDDEADLRNTLRDLLEIYGFSVVTAGNGQEALTLLREQGAPCLLLLDLMMPVMNGWELLEALNTERTEKLNKMPIVVISAAADVSEVEQRYGCQTMRKPLDMARLATLAGQHCAT